MSEWMDMDGNTHPTKEEAQHYNDNRDAIQEQERKNEEIAARNAIQESGDKYLITLHEYKDTLRDDDSDEFYGTTAEMFDQYIEELAAFLKVKLEE